MPAYCNTSNVIDFATSRARLRPQPTAELNTTDCGDVMLAYAQWLAGSQDGTIGHPFNYS